MVTLVKSVKITIHFHISVHLQFVICSLSSDIPSGGPNHFPYIIVGGGIAGMSCAQTVSV